MKKSKILLGVLLAVLMISLLSVTAMATTVTPGGSTSVSFSVSDVCGVQVTDVSSSGSSSLSAGSGSVSGGSFSEGGVGFGSEKTTYYVSVDVSASSSAKVGDSLTVTVYYDYSVDGTDYSSSSYTETVTVVSGGGVTPGPTPDPDQPTQPTEPAGGSANDAGQVYVPGFGYESDGMTPVEINKTFKVAGVIDAGQAGTANVTTAGTIEDAYKEAGADTRALFVTVRVKHTDDVKAFQKAVNKMKDADGKRLYQAVTVGSILDTINTIVSLATNVLAAIAAISLIVSALMIIVTMFMSVSERTKEIGILRALGESKKDVRNLFTSESLLIGLASFILAVILAFGIGAGLNSALYQIAKFDMIQISLGNVVMTLILALVISFLAALLPARRAAKLNPIDALSAD